MGICRGSPGLPRVLRDRGYRDRWIPGRLPGENADTGHPIFAVASQETRHTLIVEIASGCDIDADQLARYEKITAVALREGTSLSREQTETYDVAVFGQAEHRDDLRRHLEDIGLARPLVLKTAEGLVLDTGTFAKAALTKVFRPQLALDWQSVPTSWIPIDHGSDRWEVAEAVLADVVARVTQGESRIEITGICERQALGTFAAKTDREELHARIRSVLAEAAQEEFQGYFSLRDWVLEVSGGTRQVAGFRDPRTLKKLLRLQVAFLDRLGRATQRGLFPA